jgi:GTP-binding protein HflX
LAVRSQTPAPAVIRDLIDLQPPQERAILVGAPVKRTNARHHVTEHLEELARLTDTAGAVVVGTLTQQLDRPDPSTYIGRGKVEELKALIAEKDATLVIFDDELSPAQGKNLEGELNKRVIDRAELILDIFAVRARSAEARMQVELAQLEYSLPRLVRMWTHLEKFRGGIGVRGPGETQLETDRRLVGHRIRLLKDKLADVAKAREIQRAGRGGAFRASLVGYTNAGKSSILRGISHAKDVFVEDRLFATLDPLTREVDLGDHQSVLLTDTVGFIRKLPHHLVASFRATLEEVREADLLLHVIDASHPTWEEQRLVVDEVLAWRRRRCAMCSTRWMRCRRTSVRRCGRGSRILRRIRSSSRRGTRSRGRVGSTRCATCCARHSARGGPRWNCWCPSRTGSCWRKCIGWVRCWRASPMNRRA